MDKNVLEVMTTLDTIRVLLAERRAMDEYTDPRVWGL